jgi:hypothetical protein
VPRARRTRASLTAAIIDCQGVKSAEKGDLVSIRMAMIRQEDQRQEAPPSRRCAGFVAPRHRLPRRYIQDRDGGILLLATLFGMYPFLQKLFADGGYQGTELQKALTKIFPTWKLKSPSAPITPKDLWYCRAVGS